MAAVLVPVVLLVIVAVVAVMAVKRFSRSEMEHADRLQDLDRPTLMYEVPAGQDPALVLVTLTQAGYDVSHDAEPGPSSPILIIGAPHGGPPDRESVRETLERLDETNIVPKESGPIDRPPVRFLDEQAG
jgi:hypothetical protein